MEPSTYCDAGPYRAEIAPLRTVVQLGSALIDCSNEARHVEVNVVPVPVDSPAIWFPKDTLSFATHRWKDYLWELEEVLRLPRPSKEEGLFAVRRARSDILGSILWQQLVERASRQPAVERVVEVASNIAKAPLTPDARFVACYLQRPEHLYTGEALAEDYQWVGPFADVLLSYGPSESPRDRRMDELLSPTFGPIRLPLVDSELAVLLELEAVYLEALLVCYRDQSRTASLAALAPRGKTPRGKTL